MSGRWSYNLSLHIIEVVGIMAGKIRSIIEIIIQTAIVAGVVYIIARAVL